MLKKKKPKRQRRAISIVRTRTRKTSTRKSRHRLSPLRILIVIDRFNIGGTETHVLTHTRHLLKKGTYVVVAGKRGKMLDSFAALGCPIYEIDFVSESNEPDWESKPELAKALANIIRSERIEIVHGHQIPSGLIAHEVCAQLNVPFVFTAHGLYYDTWVLHAISQNSVMISVSPAVSRTLASQGIGSITISNGLDPVEYDVYDTAFRNSLRRRMNIPEDAFVILYAGRLSWEKGDICKDIMQVCARFVQHGYDELRLLIVGGGNKEQEVTELAGRLERQTGRPFIHMVGEALHMRPYYAISDAVIGTGRVALEALACKRPLIAAGTKGYVGLLKPSDYEKGWDCWFGDHASEQNWQEHMLADQIKKLIEGSDQIPETWLELGRKWVRERYHIDSASEKLLAVYRKLAN